MRRGASRLRLASRKGTARSRDRAPFAVEGPGAPPLQERPLGLLRSVSPGTFATLGVPLLAGRDVGVHDGPDAPHVVVVSRATARRLFGDGPALGRRILLGSRDGGQPAEVVGVVGDVRSRRVGEENEIEMYRPYAQRTLTFAQIVVRVAGGEPLALAPALRRAVRDVDPLLPVGAPAAYADVVRRSLGPERLAGSFLGLFGALALTLAALGTDSMVRYDIGQRAREIGVRLVLGADRAAAVRLVLRQGLVPVAAGLALGLAGALAAGPVLASQLFETSPRDPTSLAATLAVFTTVAVLACWLPLRRWLENRAMKALRQG